MATALKIVQRFHPDVEQVVDATRNTVIEVTKRDINTQARRNHTECALAIACKRTKDVDGVIIGLKFSYLVKGKKAVRYANPESASREIVSFDRTGDFAPGVYHLAKVPETSKLGAHSSPAKRPAHSGSRVERAKAHRTEGVRHYEYD